MAATVPLLTEGVGKTTRRYGLLAIPRGSDATLRCGRTAKVDAAGGRGELDAGRRDAKPRHFASPTAMRCIGCDPADPSVSFSPMESLSSRRLGRLPACPRKFPQQHNM